MSYVNRERERELNDFPFFKKKYLEAFDKMLKNMPDKATITWKSAEDVYNWWLHSDKIEKQIDGQMEMNIEETD